MLRLGVMVSLRDYSEMDVPGSNLSELLLFEGDLESMTETQLSGLEAHWPPVEFVHTQEFVTVNGRRTLVDLSSEDEDVRAMSVDVVSRTRDLARSIGPVPVVIHPGGIRASLVGHEALSANLESSLRSLGPSHLLLENMPWYYWFDKSERMVSNLCVSVEDFERFGPLVSGFTLDLCHGYLSKAEGDAGYSQLFVSRYGSLVKHLHVSDAAVPDREGLQIGDGELDFSWLRGSTLPITLEVWNGHKDGGAGFRKAVEMLRRLEACGEP